MALSARLQLRQTQSLVITPQLMQAIRLLQMSSLELERFVAAEIEQNPLLEEGDPAQGSLIESSEEITEPAETAADDIGVDIETSDLFPEQVGSDSGWTRQALPRTAAAATLDLGNDPGAVATESLVALLEQRIDAAFSARPVDRLIALTLLAGLEETGYLSTSTDLVAARLGTAVEHVERVLKRCQNMAPSGLFARSLAECLALQLAEQNRLDPAMQILLSNLDRLAAGDRSGLCELCGVEGEDLDEMVAEICALDPKPGLAYVDDAAPTLVPDVFVRTAPNGGWSVELNDETLPRLIVNRTYHAQISKRAGEAERRYLSDCLQKASWLEKSLDQRARTVLNVAAEIVRRQARFLSDGVSGLKPLNLRMVADALGIHESTVSRAAANKTIATPRGIFEFRYFFTGAIAASLGGEAHSAEAVRDRIRRLIADESPDDVLSDDAVVAILSRQGVEIARRTVAKYREIMRIGSSVERRREKRLRAAS